MSMPGWQQPAPDPWNHTANSEMINGCSFKALDFGGILLLINNLLIHLDHKCLVHVADIFSSYQLTKEVPGAPHEPSFLCDSPVRWPFTPALCAKHQLHTQWPSSTSCLSFPCVAPKKNTKDLLPSRGKSRVYQIPGTTLHLHDKHKVKGDSFPSTGVWHQLNLLLCLLSVVWHSPHPHGWGKTE